MLTQRQKSDQLKINGIVLKDLYLFICDKEELIATSQFMEHATLKQYIELVQDIAHPQTKKFLYIANKQLELIRRKAI